MSDNITKISMERIDDHVNFQATNTTGNSILMDGSEAIGGKGNGVRPMETLLMGVAGCSSIDIVLILQKMKQDLLDIKVEVTATTIKVEDAKEYDTIHVHYDLYGPLKESKVEKAINLSLEKYCSVSKMLESKSSITSSFKIHSK
jgi:putative redox protein